MEKEQVPLTAFTENFSSMPFIAPPPLGNEMGGISIALDFVLPPSVLRKEEEDPEAEFSFIGQLCACERFNNK
jgi:hypothetical protein